MHGASPGPGSPLTPGALLPALLPAQAPSLLLVGDARVPMVCVSHRARAELSIQTVWFCSHPLTKAVLVFCLIDTSRKWCLGSTTCPGLGHEPSCTPWAADTGHVEAASEKSNWMPEHSILGIQNPWTNAAWNKSQGAAADGELGALWGQGPRQGLCLLLRACPG